MEDEKNLDKLIKQLKNHKLTEQDIFDLTKWNKKGLNLALTTLSQQGVNVDISRQHKGRKLLYHINMLPDNSNVYFISGPSKIKKQLKFAATSDLHFASNFHLPKTFYETMKKVEDMGIKRVYCAGDVIDGRQIYRGHLENIMTPSIEGQTDIAAEALSKHPNLEFWAIAGNHDYSFTKLSGSKPLSILESKIDNFKNLGDLKADVIYEGLRIRLLHGGSGRAYARSYPSQTYLRDYFGGQEKQDFKNMPDFILLGHYHTLYMGKDHGIWVFQSGSFQDGDNEYCVRRGLTGPNGAFVINAEHQKGIINEITSTYIQPKIASKEKGKAFSKTTIKY